METIEKYNHNNILKTRREWARLYKTKKTEDGRNIYLMPKNKTNINFAMRATLYFAERGQRFA